MYKRKRIDDHRKWPFLQFHNEPPSRSFYLDRNIEFPSARYSIAYMFIQWYYFYKVNSGARAIEKQELPDMAPNGTYFIYTASLCLSCFNEIIILFSPFFFLFQMVNI